MDTTKTIISMLIIFGLFVLSFFVFQNKEILPLLTTIFVATIALISNQYGIYLNKEYERKFFSAKKRIEDIENSINRLEKLHSDFFELFQQYSKYFYDIDIQKEVLSDDTPLKILFTKCSEVSAINLKFSQIYWSNYSVLSNQTKKLFSPLSEAMSINNLIAFWLEINSNKAIMENQQALDLLHKQYTGTFNDDSIKYSSSIMEYIYHLKGNKEKLLNELN